MNKVIVCIIFLLLTFGINQLEARETGSFAGSFLRYGLDAKGEALGRSLTADGSKNSSSYFYNPSLINADKKNVFLTYRSLNFDRKFIYVGFSMPLKKKANLAFGLLHTGTTDIDGRDASGENFDTFSFYENMLHLSFSLQLKNDITVGVTGKFLYSVYPKLQDNNDDIYTTGLAIDLGLNWNPKYIPGFKFGLAVRDLQGDYSWSGKKVWREGLEYTDAFPKTIDTGLSYQGKYSNYNYTFNIGIEYREKESYIKGGAELAYKIAENEIFIRSGVYNEQFNSGIGVKFILLNYQTSLDLSASFNDTSEETPITVSWKISI